MTILALVEAVAVVATVLLYIMWKRACAEADAWRETATEIANRYAYYIPDPETGCWEWQKAKDKRGYGRVARREGRSGLAHRVYYEAHRGPIPEGLALDHVCCNTSCVNPSHLDPVTPAENSRRYWRRSPEEAHKQFRRAQAARHPK